jgi:hypothetical protein
MNMTAFVILVIMASGNFLDCALVERKELASTIIRSLLLTFCSVAMGLNL